HLEVQVGREDAPELPVVGVRVVAARALSLLDDLGDRAQGGLQVADRSPAGVRYEVSICLARRRTDEDVLFALAEAELAQAGSNEVVEVTLRIEVVRIGANTVVQAALDTTKLF